MPVGDNINPSKDNETNWIYREAVLYAVAKLLVKSNNSLDESVMKLIKHYRVVSFVKEANHE